MSGNNLTPKPKVFGLGFQKTGTSSLGVILKRLEYRPVGYHDFRDMAADDTLTWDQVRDRALGLAADADSAKDTPWPLLYRELDAAFPGSKFIHVVRSPDSWIESAVKDFGDYPNAIHNLIYGTPFPKGHEDIWIERYERHNREVAAYFTDRPGDYLKVDLKDGLNYATICPFLGVPVLPEASPRSNTWLQKRFKTAVRRLGWNI